MEFVFAPQCKRGKNTKLKVQPKMEKRFPLTLTLSLGERGQQLAALIVSMTVRQIQSLESSSY